MHDASSLIYYIDLLHSISELWNNLGTQDLLYLAALVPAVLWVDLWHLKWHKTATC
jgi:hypothetical protein